MDSEAAYLRLWVYLNTTKMRFFFESAKFKHRKIVKLANNHSSLPQSYASPISPSSRLRYN